MHNNRCSQTCCCDDTNAWASSFQVLQQDEGEPKTLDRLVRSMQETHLHKLCSRARGMNIIRSKALRPGTGKPKALDRLVRLIPE